MRPLTALTALQDRLRLRRRRPGAARGVVMVASGGLGDAVLLATVFDRFAALAEPGEPVTLILRRDAAGMGFLFDGAAAVETVDYRRLDREPAYRRQVLDGLYDRHARLVLSLDYLRHPRLDESLVAACGAPVAKAMQARPWAKYDRALGRAAAGYTALFDSGPAHLDKVVRWQRFADWLHGAATDPAPVRLPARCLPAAAVPAAPTVFVQPFSAVPRKQVPPDFLARMLEAVPVDWRIRLTGAPGELDRNPAYRVLLDDPRAAYDDRSFQAILPDLLAARAVVSVDTAMLHLAAAAGVPTIGLASAAYVGEIVPYEPRVAPDNVSVLYQTMPCEGCLGDCSLAPVDGMFPCVARLDPAAARSALAGLI